MFGAKLVPGTNFPLLTFLSAATSYHAVGSLRLAVNPGAIDSPGGAG